MIEAIKKIKSKNIESIKFVKNILKSNNKNLKIKVISAVFESDIKEIINFQDLIEKMDSGSDFKEFELDFMKIVCEKMGGEIIDNSKTKNGEKDI